MHILGIHNGIHDASACLFHDYELVSAVSLERLTRQKQAGVSVDAEIPLLAIDECLSIGGISRSDVNMVCASRDHWELQSLSLHGRWWVKQQYFRLMGQKRLLRMTYMMRKQSTKDALKIFDKASFKRRYGFSKADIYFGNHHAAHAAPAYFFSEFDDALLYTADGFGDDVSYSARAGRQGALELIFGGDEMLNLTMRVNSVGMLYSYFTRALGFMFNRHEGKVTGLSAFGQPAALDEILRHFHVDDRAEIWSDFPSWDAMEQFAQGICRRLSREDAAASVQLAMEQLICDAVEKLLRATGLRSVVMGGGVVANVRLNRAVLEQTSAERVFIYPAMGDEGLSLGVCLLYLHARDGAKTWQANRYRLQSLYLGRDFGSGFQSAARAYPQVRRLSDGHIEAAVDALVRGEIVAIYTGRMEFGPRALGARSILASPVRRDVNETINRRLERSEFMPFAPVVLEDHAATVFDIHEGNRHAAHFMTITCDVHPEWRERIPAVVHVDGSARPQIINANDNPLYFRVLELFHQRTGLPVLVNTSFNVHEEPIVDTPDQALKSLTDGRIDHILADDALYSPRRARFGAGRASQSIGRYGTQRARITARRRASTPW
jgi:carbamoyltransferase